MTSSIAAVFDELGNILGVCPCCGDPFYLQETRPFRKGEKKKTIIDPIRTSEVRLDRAREKLDEALLSLGRRREKRR